MLSTRMLAQSESESLAKYQLALLTSSCPDVENGINTERMVQTD